MNALHRTTLAPVFGLCLGACTPQPGPVPPTPAFATSAAAIECARDALAGVGFLTEARLAPPPGSGVSGAPVETPTSITGRVVTPLATGQQIDFASAVAHLKVGPQGDTTVTLTVTTTTTVTEAESSGAAVRPLSPLAARARDALVTGCHAALEPAPYPRSV